MTKYVIIQYSDYRVPNTLADLSVVVPSAGTIRVWDTRRRGEQRSSFNSSLSHNPCLRIFYWFLSF